jgi:hypothetical protein
VFGVLLVPALQAASCALTLTHLGIPNIVLVGMASEHSFNRKQASAAVQWSALRRAACLGHDPSSPKSRTAALLRTTTGGPDHICPSPPPSPREPLPDDEDNPPQSIPFMNSRFAPAEQAGRMEETG